MKAFLLSLTAVTLLSAYQGAPPENSPIASPSPSASPSPPVASSPTTVSYLAVRAGEPTPKDPVPVADQATMQQLIAAATANDRAKFNQIGASPSVVLIPAID